MITNIPKAEELCESSLLLYFKAWESLTDLIQTFEDSYDEKLYKSDNSESDHDGDREDYLEKCHPELQICVNLIQQSNELALKSKIAATSPYLLLSGLESNIKAQAQDYDFYALKTVDASNLYKLVNAVCTTTLSNNFNELYQKYRNIRNMITHLGNSSELNAEKLINDMIKIYIELWPNRHWLQDRLKFTSAKPVWSISYHFSPEGYTLERLEDDLSYIAPDKFKKLFKITKSKLTSLCPQCYGATRFDDVPVDASKAKTGYKDLEDMRCIMCQSKFSVISLKCSQEECNAKKAISIDEVKYCFICGEEHGEA